MPVTLLAELTAPNQASDGWKDDIRAALPPIRSAGAGRTRGLGRCIVSEWADEDRSHAHLAHLAKAMLAAMAQEGWP